MPSKLWMSDEGADLIGPGLWLKDMSKETVLLRKQVMIEIFVACIMLGLTAKELVDSKSRFSVPCDPHIRLVVEPEEPYVVTHLLFKLAWTFLWVRVVLDHLEYTVFRQVK